MLQHMYLSMASSPSRHISSQITLSKISRWHGRQSIYYPCSLYMYWLNQYANTSWWVDTQNTSKETLLAFYHIHHKTITHFTKLKIFNTDTMISLKKIHMEFTLYKVISIQGFAKTFTIVYSKYQML